MVLSATQAFWDAEAVRFDAEPDHGLADPAVRRAWSTLLHEHVPAAPARIADLGCGTGSLAVLLAQSGHEVDGIDLSEAMVARARAKAEAAGVPVSFEQGDASRPRLPAGAYDAVLSRHVLWAMPDPSAALDRWASLLVPGGRLVLVEGHWFTGGGLRSADCERLVREHTAEVEVHALTDAALWGREIEDERYLLVATVTAR